MNEPEFSHVIDRRGITDQPVRLTANEAERAALAERFAIISIARFEAEVMLEAAGEIVSVTGSLAADIVQPCAISGEDLAMSIAEPFALRFVPQHMIGDAGEDEEIELTAEELDEIAYDGTAFDLGEAVAQSLALAIDPYATVPNADEVRREKGLIPEEASGPLAAQLAALTKR